MTYKPTDYNPFEGDFGDGGDITFSDKMVKGRKEHQCGHCKGVIKIGETHRNLVGKFEGELMSMRWCAECCEAMVEELEGSDSGFDLEPEDEFPFEARVDLHINKLTKEIL